MSRSSHDYLLELAVLLFHFVSEPDALDGPEPTVSSADPVVLEGADPAVNALPTTVLPRKTRKELIILAVQKALRDYEDDRERVVAPLGRPSVGVVQHADASVITVPVEEDLSAYLKRVTRHFVDAARETYSSAVDQMTSNTAAYFKASVDVASAPKFDPKAFILSLMDRPGSWDVGPRASLKVRIMHELVNVYVLSTIADGFEILEAEGDDAAKPMAVVSQLDRIRKQIHAELHHARLSLLTIPEQAEMLCSHMKATEAALRITHLMGQPLSQRVEMGVGMDNPTVVPQSEVVSAVDERRALEANASLVLQGSDAVVRVEEEQRPSRHMDFQMQMGSSAAFFTVATTQTDGEEAEALTGADEHVAPKQVSRKGGGRR